ncbi:long-chain-fatty-acid--CoA ligase 5 [Protopterus annectens]|uniref:long-chain-fatty-acid--CoA ligase 5 n=1 Tax=Protopterus annectens TaxID=7888 RepID=UPI001CFA8D33|nr:long-chain-fatty-acid--CoA ligase 5 [Protopterus annectens]XP_043911778.1 long-chain-fatty-acid--CoA ligase 5 [Protopterus annectens]XP_043911779.1 long-chain-fatty-acid--CoA ligase 5 [Protopterus annectens]XP_043911780.1 long-chain-fatty-acid--CoA ligase 5 [Protopterus annectens]XP_043911781.1 long-chain-fatty-acid--CoA ligase 5 [Protopterus annectens]
MHFILHFLFSPLPTPALIGLFTLGLSALVWLITRSKPVRCPVDLNKQSIGTKGSARRSALINDDTPMSYYYDDARTLYEGFQRGLLVSGNGPCLGYRKQNQPYQWLSYQQVVDRAQHLGSGLLKKGCRAASEEFIGIFAQNRPEWIISELACYTYTMVAVPLYDTLGSEAVIFIINKAEIFTVICDKADKAITLLKNCENKLTPGLKTIILMDSFENELKERGAKCGVEIVSMQEVERIGKENLQKAIPPKPEDLSIVCFTSGTTGDPKGAMLTHENVIADAAGFLKSLECLNAPVVEDISISFLPLAHMFERVVQTVMYCSGARVGFFQGDIRLLVDDMKALKPTVFPVVPRLLNRIYDKVQSGLNTPFKKRLLEFALARKHAEVKNGIIRNNSIWDKLIFQKIQATTGGRIRVMVTGAAPISPNVLSFLRAILGCHIFEAYGQTECTAGCTFSLTGDWSTGHVGAPIPCNVVKLVDVEDMNYFAANGEGEVCVKGTNVFKGYLKDPEKTEEALDSEGWLHTGDIGQWQPSGTLKIIDRKKNIFKLAQGEYIAPEKIENIYIRSAPVAQIFVHGDSLQSCLVGIIVPDQAVLPQFAAKNGLSGSYEDLCKNSVLKKAIIADMVKLGKEAGLKTFEQVKDIYVHPELFTIENGLLTPTLKAKRAEIVKLFKEQIDNLYANLN